MKFRLLNHVAVDLIVVAIFTFGLRIILRLLSPIPLRDRGGPVYKMHLALELDGRSNFFINPPAHLCAVTYMTEISSTVT